MGPLKVHPHKKAEQGTVFINYFTAKPEAVEMPRAGRATWVTRAGSQQGCCHA